MNDLLDRRLKKIDHNVKYTKVAFDELNTKKFVKLAIYTSQPKKRTLLLCTLPLPVLAFSAVLFFQIFDTPSSTSIQTGSMVSDKAPPMDYKISEPLKAESLTNSNQVNRTFTEYPEQKPTKIGD